MDERTVVTLRIVEKDELPVAGKLVGDTSRRLQIREVPTREPADQRRKVSLEAFGVILRQAQDDMQIDKDKAFPECDRGLFERILCSFGAGNLRHVARGLQLSIERVRPGVIWALDRSRKVARSFAAETR